MLHLDFDLSIDQQSLDPEHYVVRVIESPAGEATEAIPSARLSTDLTDAAALTSMAIFGTQLFRSVMTGRVLELFRASQAMASEREAKLRLKIRANSPALDGVWWETLRDPAHETFVAQCRETPMVRYVEAQRPVETLTAKLPLRLLGVAAAPPGTAKVSADEEIAHISGALERLVAEGRVEIVWLKRPTRRSLRTAFSRQGWHIFHFIGHGSYETTKREVVLWLEDERGRPDPMTAADLSTLLVDAGCRLALLNSCKGAAPGGVDGLASLAGDLVRRGVPAAIGMRGPISDAGGIVLAEQFYEAVARGDPADVALTEARKALAGESAHFQPQEQVPNEWAAPVLYMRSPDGCLFDADFAESPRVELSPATGVLEEAVDRLHLAWMRHHWRAAAAVFVPYVGIMVASRLLGISSDFTYPCDPPATGSCRANGFLAAATWGYLLPVLLPLAAAAIAAYLRVLNTQFASIDPLMTSLGSSPPFSVFLSGRIARAWPWLVGGLIGAALAITLLADVGYIVAPLELRWLDTSWLGSWEERDWSNRGHLRYGASAPWLYLAFNVAAYGAQTFAIYSGLLLLVLTTYLFGASIGRGLAETELADIFRLRGDPQRRGLYKIVWDYRDARCGLKGLDNVFVSFHLLVFVGVFTALCSVMYNVYLQKGPDTGSFLLMTFTLLYVPLDLLWILYPYWSRFPKALPAHLVGKPGYVEPSPWPLASEKWTWFALCLVTVTWLVVVSYAARFLWPGFKQWTGDTF